MEGVDEVLQRSTASVVTTVDTEGVATLPFAARFGTVSFAAVPARALVLLVYAGYVMLSVAAMIFFQQGDALQNSFIANQVALGHIDVYRYFDQVPGLTTLRTTMPPLPYLVDGAYLKILMLMHLDPVSPTRRLLFRQLFGETRGLSLLEGLFLIKLPNVAALFGCFFLVKKLVQEPVSRRIARILWLASPCVVVTVMMQSQNDVFPAAATLAALVAFRNKRLLWGMALLGIAAAFKDYALLLIPITAIMVSNRNLLQIVKLGVTGAAIPVVIALPFLNSSFINRVLLAHDGSSILRANGVGRYPDHLFLVAYAGMLVLAWICSKRDNDIQDLAAMWMTTILSVFLLSWWFSQWLVWLVPMVLVLAARDRVMLWLWGILNIFLLTDNIVNAPGQLDGAMLMPIFGETAGKPIYGHLYLYGLQINPNIQDFVYMIEMALFAALAARALQWLLSHGAVGGWKPTGWARPKLVVAQSLLGPLFLVPYVLVMVIQHFISST